MRKIKNEDEPIEIPEKEIIDRFEKKDNYNEEYYFKLLNKNREIHLYDEINACSADLLVTKIKVMNILDSKKPIIIEINSGGGEVTAGFCIINAIEHSKAPIHTIISGEACSMAALIFICGKQRSIYENSFIMFHPLSSGQQDYLAFIKDRTKALIYLNNIVNKLYKKYTCLDDLDLHKTEAGELWLHAKDAKKKGVCDKIIY